MLSGDGDTSVCFCGMVGEDAEAQLVSSGLKEYDVLPALLSTPQPTAACLCLVRTGAGSLHDSVKVSFVIVSMVDLAASLVHPARA